MYVYCCQNVNDEISDATCSHIMNQESGHILDKAMCTQAHVVVQAESYQDRYPLRTRVDEVVI